MHHFPGDNEINENASAFAHIPCSLQQSGKILCLPSRRGLQQRPIRTQQRHLWSESFTQHMTRMASRVFNMSAECQKVQQR